MKHTRQAFAFTPAGLLRSLVLLGLACAIGACSAAGTALQPATPTAQPPLASPTALGTATPIPSPTPEPVPLTFWADPSLPDELTDAITLPEGSEWVSSAAVASFLLRPADSSNPTDKVLAETTWTYTLVAPFLTVQDSFPLQELINLLRGLEVDSGILPAPSLLIRTGDLNAICQALGLKPAETAAAALVQVVPDDYFDSGSYPTDGSWALLPFHLLHPVWKVLSVAGTNPLDAKFESSNDALSVKYQLSVPRELSQRLSEDQLATLQSALPEGNRQADQLTSLIMTGVTAMARDTAYVMSTEGVTFPATEIGEVLRSADLTHISNEVSFYEGCPFPNPDYPGYIFCSDPEYIGLLEAVGADIIELTGNHNNDVRALYKEDSVPFTLDLYRQHNMRWYAGGTNLAEARAPLLLENNGNKLAFIGCNSYGPEMAWATESRSGAAPCGDFGWIGDTIAQVKAQGYIPIVTFQYQEDYYTSATSTAKRDFRLVAGMGAAIINGSQSHVSKVMEFYNGAFVDYGLGNLFFDQPGFYITYPSIIQRHFFYNGQYISTQLITVTVKETGKLRLMTDAERQNFLGNLFAESRALMEEK